MGVTRARIDAEGSNHQQVLDDLNGAFALLFSSRQLPRETEFIEEVVESHIRDDGAINYRGRRVIRFLDPPPDHGDAVSPDPPGPLTPVSWVISGAATSAASPSVLTVMHAAQDAATTARVTTGPSWEVRDATGSTVGAHLTMAAAADLHPQPWYYMPGIRP